MKNNKIIIFALGVVAVATIEFIYWSKNSSPKQPQIIKPVLINKPIKQQTIEIPQIKYPINSLPNQFPNSENSSSVKEQGFQEWAIMTLGKLNVEKVLIIENFINRFVIAIDNASAKIIPANMSPIQLAPGRLIIKSSVKNIEISEENYKRYDQYLALAEAGDLKSIVLYYRKMYPLFQTAYKSQGEDGYFNDKLIEVIDLILSTPEPKNPIKLYYSTSQYEYIDPKLESLPAIQKIIIRMGPQKEKKIKLYFRELRHLLIDQNSAK
jgi:hypothetical protein